MKTIQNAFIQRIRNYILLFITWFLIIIPLIVKSQNVSTVSEIYNYEVNDIFQYEHYYAGAATSWTRSITKFEIIEKYFSQGEDTIFYVREINSQSNNVAHTDWVYHSYSDIIFYTNLDSLINFGQIDSVFVDTSLYNGRVINQYSVIDVDKTTDCWAVGCGHVLIDVRSYTNPDYIDINRLAYFKKGTEEWGTQLPAILDNISTISEIYDYEVGDIFHFNYYGYGGNSWGTIITNIKIIDKYYSPSNDSLFYVRIIARKTNSSSNTTWEYENYQDIIIYKNLDSLINSGQIDVVKVDSGLYNGRLINSVLNVNYPIVRDKSYVVGCGLAYSEVLSTEHPGGGSSESLKYFKKGIEEWGLPIVVTLDNISTVSEINNFEVGDIFHFVADSSGGNSWARAISNIKIIDKYYSQSSDSLFYVRDIVRKSNSSYDTTWEYEYNQDTIFFIKLDSLINFGQIDLVNVDGGLYNGRLINSVFTASNQHFVSKSYAVGCGQVKYESLTIEQPEGSIKDSLVYFKKGIEEWGIPELIKLDNIKTGNEISDIKIYPNPTNSSLNVISRKAIIRSVTILSIEGKRLITFKMDHGNSIIDISKLPSNAYILEIELDDQIMYKTLIKK